ncbi:hypothetical protein ACLOJK_020714 [Asimina triloba]
MVATYGNDKQHPVSSIIDDPNSTAMAAAAARSGAPLPDPVSSIIDGPNLTAMATEPSDGQRPIHPLPRRAGSGGGWSWSRGQWHEGGWRWNPPQQQQIRLPPLSPR